MESRDMKLVSETKALESLSEIKTALKADIGAYEVRAKNCQSCNTRGVCCQDEHFVNVHISRLEAAAIEKTLGRLKAPKRDEIYERIERTVEKYGLTNAGDTYAKTFACPLFERDIGCLIHNDGKPVPCMIHACYERKADLPPDELQSRAEQKIDVLNTLTYGRRLPLLPLPLAIKKTR
jgi:hypothetical protein